ncbi:MAG: polyprenyl synthetase family protein [Lachnospiraceae bacterium]|nr:polyprenyl synthetase family protein [Lachnospiraceae bacterium]
MKYSTKDIEDIIYPYLPEEKGYAKPVLEAMNYAFRAGGKRLRPMMMKLCFDMFCDDGVDVNVVEPFMAAIEMIHTYSLIHDDLPALDNDELRRGMPTVHVKYGEDIAVLAGDGLLNYAYQVACGALRHKPGNVCIEKAMYILTSKPGIYGMIGGQTLDVTMSGQELSDSQLDYIYKNKTSALIECAMTIGATLAGASDEVIEMIEQVATCVGMAFQVQDDILDVVGDAQKLGKPVLSDEKNDKYTYVTIHGMDVAKSYVHSMSDKANNILNSLSVVNNDAKDCLMNLIVELINRDK